MKRTQQLQKKIINTQYSEIHNTVICILITYAMYISKSTYFHWRLNVLLLHYDILQYYIIYSNIIIILSFKTNLLL